MKGKLYILSTGPGDISYLTQDALKALDESQVIVSYNKYIDDIKTLIQNKTIITSGMTKEIDRCNQAIDNALLGMTVSLISNGDSHVYGLGSLVIELIDQKDLWDKIDLKSIPGITSFLAVASKVGAPISQDFSIISLSDRLTPIDLIEKRIRCSLDADFVMGIYNPLSKTRIKPYELFLSILSEYNIEKRPIILASNIGRPTEKIILSCAEELIKQGSSYSEISMSTLIIVGNSISRWTKNNMVLTPRGYLSKYDIDGKLKSS